MRSEDISAIVKTWLETNYYYGAKWEKRYEEGNEEVEIVVHVIINIGGKILNVSMSQVALQIERDIKDTVQRMDRILYGSEELYLKILE